MPTALPGIQVKENNNEVLLFWEVTPGQHIVSYNVYWGLSEDTSYIPHPSDPTRLLFNNYTSIVDNIPNYPTMGKKNTSYSFKRSTLGLTESSSFYVAISAMLDNAAVETPLGQPRFVTYISEQPVSAGSVHSAITGSQRYQVTVGTSPVRQTFASDLKQLEVFNFSQTAKVFVDLTGLDASASESMPLMPYGYYAIGRQLSKDTGISMVASEENVDVRIVAHS